MELPKLTYNVEVSENERSIHSFRSSDEGLTDLRKTVCAYFDDILRDEYGIQKEAVTGRGHETTKDGIVFWFMVDHEMLYKFVCKKL